jgi:hypothetical protein
VCSQQEYENVRNQSGDENASSRKSPLKNAYQKRIGFLHPDCLLNSSCDAEEWRPEQFAWSNILEPIQPTKAHPDEKELSISNSTEEGLNSVLSAIERLISTTTEITEELYSIREVSCVSTCRRI